MSGEVNMLLGSSSLLADVEATALKLRRLSALKLQTPSAQHHRFFFLQGIFFLPKILTVSEHNTPAANEDPRLSGKVTA